MGDVPQRNSACGAGFIRTTEKMMMFQLYQCMRRMCGGHQDIRKTHSVGDVAVSQNMSVLRGAAWKPCRTSGRQMMMAHIKSVHVWSSVCGHQLDKKRD